MNAYVWPHEFDGRQPRPGFLQRCLRLLIAIMSGAAGDQDGWEARTRER
jgi:hypothetical protein